MNDVRRKQLETIREALENLQEPVEKIKLAEQKQAESEASLDCEANVELLASVEKGISDSLLGIESILEL